MKLMEELDEKRQKQWKLNKTRIVNESHLSHKLSVEICPPIVEVPTAGTTRIDLKAIAPKPPQRVVKAKSLYTRTIAPKDFDIIGNGRPSGKIDSAGSHLNLRHAVRQTQRMKLMLALDRPANDSNNRSEDEVETEGREVEDQAVEESYETTTPSHITIRVDMRTSGRRLIAIDLDALTDYDTDTDADEEYSEPVVSVTDKDVEPNDSVTSDPEMMKPSDNDSDMSGGQVRDTTREQRSDCESNTGHKSVKIDTRYRKRQIDYKLVDKRTGMSDQKSVLLNETSPEAMEVRIVCFHCEKRYHSMADFRHHYKKRHFKDNKPCAGVKLKLIPKSVDKTSTHKHKH
ncbi:unnamed protein product, partial [Oppiella nova]